MKDALTSALNDFSSLLDKEELDSFLAKFKASGDNSEQLAHPRPRSPSNCPAMIEKMLGTSGFEGKLVWTAADLNDEESNSRFDSSLFCQLDSMLELETTPNSQISYELLENAITSFNRDRGIGQDAVTSKGYFYNGGRPLSIPFLFKLKSGQLLYYAPIKAYNRAIEQVCKDGNICTPRKNKTVRKIYDILYTIALKQGKNDVTLESLMDAIVSIDIVPFCATIVTWLEFGAAEVGSDGKVIVCH